MADSKNTSLSGLTDDEAKEFHGIFMQSFIIFVAVAVFAHILAWIWRPWLPGKDGYAAVIEGSNSVATTLAQVAPYLT
ncbi:light-harvesting complex 1 beta chain [Natronocella acetinitrilica]|jgi:light-harvesting complex 1 beta chain|uniref:Light-harvesting complex 1 beta chain n=1 Tax=Natronocella acetinitrilica TaxID=414046 RepID=A0AAE3KCJ2_9GAMM|nr:light-harvesting antenna LH1, beta subunit [Natronocella acetinitrilica]MCP1675831.1 light-harvesting complex 1 beta chain [Natronocella acetinitrilica]